MSRPSVAELRPVVHPPGVKDRRSGEHWMGRLYMDGHTEEVLKEYEKFTGK